MHCAVIAGMQSMVPMIRVGSRDDYVHDLYW